ncbi:MAG: oxidoreductase [Anaerolineales bacterium]|nr:DUF3597 domain-containing protein [Anaerolineae bacterium]PWB71323.1 MAG: oxidoreductase [Anaerolineales bacterium]
MSLFSKILGKLGIGKDKDAPAPTAAATAAPKPAAAPAPKPAAPVKSPVKPSMPPAAQGAPRPAATAMQADMMKGAQKPAAPAPMAEVDVVKKLEGLAKGTGLDWKVSIVDLLKLLEIDSSREARNELAKELGCPEEFMKDSAKMNTWLHKTVLKKIAENGGNIPKELLD